MYRNIMVVPSCLRIFTAVLVLACGMFVNDTLKPYIWCSAAIIDKQWAVIPANCIIDFATGDYIFDFRLLVGTNLLDNGGSNYTVSSIFIHPEYNYNDTTFNIINDIALLKTEEEFLLSETVQIIEIGEVVLNQYCTMMGWGVLDDHGTYPNELYFAHTLTLSDDDCERLAEGASNPPYLGPGKMCTFSSGGVSPLTGDKGPLVCYNKVVGILSYDIDYDGFPFVNTRLDYYKEWIDEIMSS